MGIIREPKGVDFIVAPSNLTDKDRKVISEIIANYKKTGKIPSKLNRKKPINQRSATVNRTLPKVGVQNKD